MQYALSVPHHTLSQYRTHTISEPHSVCHTLFQYRTIRSRSTAPYAISAPHHTLFQYQAALMYLDPIAI
eukprot:3939035-Rhodomonas_salina.2